ncbi:phosphohydrolase [Dysgonomonas sp. GY617]|uniref:phosphohydrolase n=1 Tax=Dysgonomonas sp. GY617 TaxID=2780420 RepID=UPI0018842587|nr:phosphohydrolase [Dysgonomonas sp. GY617]MBF0577153.1 phosphohydrolase [Dysgonomonas sp. GY617]
MVNSIRMFSGILFSPISPNKNDIKIEDIAHALSLLTRANGHFPEFYSVAQHSIACCKEAIARNYGKKVAIACLLHDAGEAYMSDITRPLKKHLEFYIKTEAHLLELIYSIFIEEPLTDKEINEIKLIDDLMLYHEFLHFMKVEVVPFSEDLITNPDFKFVQFDIVETEFKDIFQHLMII